MASIFWDAKGVLLVDYLDKGHIITGAYFADLLRQLWEKNQTDSAWKADKKTALPPGQCSAIKKCGFLFVEDLPYSPDYYLYLKM